MYSYAPSIKRLVSELEKLPGIGKKTATRLALHILKVSKDDAERLAGSILDVKELIKLCSLCFNLSDSDPCSICSNAKRMDESICVVEDVNDLMAIESAGFKGKYHVLHGVISPLHGIGPEDIRVAELIERLKKGTTKEVIIATDPDTYGEATALYITRLIKPLGVKVTRIAFGVPMGGDIEYVDNITLSKAIEGRREI